MANVIMKKTVYDGKVYHKCGEKVEISDEKAKFYLDRGYANLAIDNVVIHSAPQEAESKQEIPAETKEQKIVYSKKKKK